METVSINEKYIIAIIVLFGIVIVEKFLMPYFWEFATRKEEEKMDFKFWQYSLIIIMIICAFPFVMGSRKASSKKRKH